MLEREVPNPCALTEEHGRAQEQDSCSLGSSYDGERRLEVV